MVSPSEHGHTDPWTAFGVGVLGGVIGGLSLLSFAGIFVVALIAIVGGLALRPRPFGAAGVLLGWATSWIIVLAGAQARCDPASCVAPDLSPWVVVAASIAATGLGLLAIGIVRPPWVHRATATARAVAQAPVVRRGVALLLGAVAGLFGASLLLPGWTTAVVLGGWFAWRNRSTGRRREIAWFVVAAIVTFVARRPR
jgi:hypothetical protein